jgi:putative heme-binding domain-containing protein
LQSLQPDSTSAHHEYRELVTEALQLSGDATNTTIWETAASFPPTSEIPSSLVLGLAEDTARHGTSLQALPKPESTADETVRRLINEQLAAARDTASDNRRTPAQRLLAVRLLAHDQAETAGPILIALLDPAVPPELQLAAAGAIGELRDVALLSQALAGWDRQSIATRRALLNCALRSGPLTAKLLEALEVGQIELVEIATEVRPLLERLADEGLRRRAEELLAQLPVVDRSAVIEGRREALSIAGDRQRGGAIFAAHCATCHLVEGVGARVGPDLSGIAARPPEALLVDILDPSRDVPPDYMNYVVATTGGRVLSGLLAGETATTIGLRLPDGVAQSVAREDVERFQATGKSLMPEGFEARLDSRQLADLLAFLAQPAGQLVREAPAPAASEPAPQQQGR